MPTLLVKQERGSAASKTILTSNLCSADTDFALFPNLRLANPTI
jgi:hypothetical protein